MSIYTDNPYDDGAVPSGLPLISSLGVNPKITKTIDTATKDWLDKHPEATTTVMDNSVDAAKLAPNAADGLRIMNRSQLGVAKVGTGLAINNDGALELDGGDIAPAVAAWLNVHPEATTTVQDGAITTPKLANGAITTPKLADGIVTDEKLAQSGGVLEKVSSLKSELNQTEQEVFDDTILNLSWEKGSFDANGMLSDSNYRARVSSFLAVKENDLIIMPNNGSYEYSIQQYNASKTFVSALGWLNPEFYIYQVPSGVGFVRFGVKVNGGVAITDTILASLNANKFTQMTPFMDHLRASVNANTEELAEVSETVALINDKTYASLTWEQGSITDGEDVDNTKRARIQGYIPVSKGDKLVFKTNGGAYGFAYSLIGTNYVFKEVVGWVTEDTIYEIPANVAYIRVNAKAVSDVTFDQTELDKIAQQLFVIHTGYEATDFLNKKPKAIRAWDPLVGQDCTMVDGKLWIFYDSSIQNKIYKLDLSTEQATTETTQDFGHCNSVDYNPNNDCLLVYKSSTNNDPQAVIYKNPKGKTALSLSDADCTLVNLYNGTSYLNPSASICWGENDNIIYMIDGIYDNVSNNHANPNITIKKIMLGMGSNDYSSVGYGTYVSGKADNEYNGTCKVIKTYNGAITVGLNAIFNPTNTSGTAQGMEFDGDIYIGWGFSGHNFLQIKLHDDDDSYQVVRNFMHYFTDNAGNIRYLEPEMLALNGNQIICGSIKSPYAEMLSFSRN